jgi:hypothetical protein
VSGTQHLTYPCTDLKFALNAFAGPTTQNVAMEAAMALAMLKYVPVGTSAGANLVTDALQVMRDGGCVGLARIVYIHRI